MYGISQVSGDVLVGGLDAALDRHVEITSEYMSTLVSAAPGTQRHTNPQTTEPATEGCCWAV